MTIETVNLTEQEARRLTERIRTALDRVSTAWADLAERITEAYQRRADLALGYATWAEYADAELRPAEGLAVEVRRQLVSMLSAAGMSTRAIAPTVGVKSPDTVSRDLRQVSDDRTPDREPYPQARRAPWPERREEPAERIDPATGEAVPAPTFKPLDVTDWTPEELDAQIAADDAVIESYERATVPAPVKVVGLDGKTYTRPEPKAAETRDYTPEPKRGTDAHALRYVVIPTLSAWSDLWADKALLDNTVDAEEAAQILRDLSKLTPVLSQIRRLLTSRTESIK